MRNEKIYGTRDLLDQNSNKIDINKLSDFEKVFTILKWSAIPGLSRHHWGTDFDIIDQNALPNLDYQIQLIPAEYEQDGIFHKLSLWIDQAIKDNHAEGFIRPFPTYSGGVMPEMWHISYSPMAKNFQDSMTYDMFHEILDHSEFELIDVVKKNSRHIYDKFILK